jgi:hypothetical protein
MQLHVVVEGQTEESFVKRCLGPHLDSLGVYTTPILVTTRRDERTGKKVRKGGGRWKQWRRDIRILLRDGRADLRVTTLFDLYGLPRDFPGLDAHAAVGDTAVRTGLLEAAMAKDLDDRRVLPYLQRHEFEALVLVGLDELHSVLDAGDDIAGLESLRSEVGATPPEDVDDGPETAPSKRLLARIPSYQKTTHGPLVVEGVGLTRLRTACPRFDAWVRSLESLATAGPESA